MSMVHFQVELSSQLPVHCLHNLPHLVDDRPERCGQLYFLVAPGQCQQSHLVVVPQLLSKRSGHKPFVGYHRHVMVLSQQLRSHLHVPHVSASQLKVQYHPSQCHQQMEFVGVDLLPLGGYRAVSSSLRSPLSYSTAARSKMELDHRHRQAVNHTLTLLSYIQQTQHHSSDQVEGLCQVSTPSVEAALGRNVREQVEVVMPLAKEFSLHIPTSTLPYQSHSQKFTVRAARCRTRPAVKVKRSAVSPHVIHYAVHPQAEVVKAANLRYHWVSSGVWFAVPNSRLPITSEVTSSTFTYLA